MEIRFTFFSLSHSSIFSFGIAVTHNICCFCQHMILFSYPGRRKITHILLSFEKSWSCNALFIFMVESVLDCLLSLPPVLLPDMNMVIWHLSCVGFCKSSSTVKCLSLLCHSLFLAQGCADAVVLLFLSIPGLLTLHFMHERAKPLQSFWLDTSGLMHFHWF